MGRDNVWRALPRRARDEVTRLLVQAAGVRIERIVSTGQASPPGFWYDQAEHEWVLLLSGRARLRIAGRRRVLTLKPGDHVWLPAHTRHRVDWTDPAAPTVWLVVFWRAHAG